MPSEWNDLPDLPPELEGAMSDLGTFRAEYRAGWATLLYLFLGLFLLVGGAGLTALLVYIVLDDRPDVGLVKLVFLTAALVVGGAFMCFRSVRAWGVRVLVFDRCLVFLKGGSLRVFGWDEITGFSQRTTSGMWEKMMQSSYYLTLHRRDGAMLRIDAYVGRAKELGARVQVELARRKAAAEPEA